MNVEFQQSQTNASPFQRYNFPQSSKNINLSKTESQINNNYNSNYSQRKNQHAQTSYNKENENNTQFSFQASKRADSQTIQSSVLSNLLENEQNKKYFTIFEKNMQKSNKKNNENTAENMFKQIDNKYKMPNQIKKPLIYQSPSSLNQQIPDYIPSKINQNKNLTNVLQKQNFISSISNDKQFDRKRQDLLSQINNNMNYTEKLEQYNLQNKQFAQSIGPSKPENFTQLFKKPVDNNNNSNIPNFDIKKYNFNHSNNYMNQNNQIENSKKNSQLNPSFQQTKTSQSVLKNRFTSPDVDDNEQRRISIQQTRGSYQQIPQKYFQNQVNQQQLSDFEKQKYIANKNEQFYSLPYQNSFQKNTVQKNEQQFNLNSYENISQQQQQQQKQTQLYSQLQTPVEHRYQQQIQFNSRNVQTPQSQIQYCDKYQQKDDRFQSCQNQLQNHYEYNQKFQNPSTFNTIQQQQLQQNYQFQQLDPIQQQFFYKQQQNQNCTPSQQNYYNYSKEIQLYDEQKIQTPREINEKQIPQQYSDCDQNNYYSQQQFHQNNGQQLSKNYSQNNYFSQQQFPQNLEKQYQINKNFQNSNNFNQNQQQFLNPLDFTKNMQLDQGEQQEVTVFLECLQEKLKIEKEITDIKKELGDNANFQVFEIFKLFDEEKYGIINSEIFNKGMNRYFGLNLTKKDAIKILRRNCQDYEPKLSFQEFSEIFIDKQQKIIIKEQLNTNSNSNFNLRAFQHLISNLMNKIMKAEDIQEKLRKKLSKGSKLVDLLQFSGNVKYY